VAQVNGIPGFLSDPGVPFTCNDACLSQIYRHAVAVLDAIGWRRPDDPPVCVDVRSRRASPSSSCAAGALAAPAC
jgi:hypothetical protein